ncbi:hypothetical protein AAMO2058_001141600 [Amorphochlora amoebiformis]
MLLRYRMLNKGHWYEEMINNRNKSVVRDMKWTADGQKICIVYEDGAVIVGSVSGDRLWGKDLDLTLACVEWSPDAQHILFGTTKSEVFLYDGSGNRISKVTLAATENVTISPMIGLDWYPGIRVGGKEARKLPSLAVGFTNGTVQIMSGIGDKSPVLIATGMEATRLKWNPSGTVLAIAGSTKIPQETGDATNQNMVQFYTPMGRHLRTLKVPGTNISSLTWEKGSLRIAMAVQCYIYFANIRPDYKWGFIGNTLVHVFQKPDRSEHCVSFWDHKTKERRVKFARKLMALNTGGDHCVFCTKTSNNLEPYALILCNSIGIRADSKYTAVEPIYTTMTSQYIVTASRNLVYFWQYRSANSELMSLPFSEAKRSDRTMMWHIDHAPSVENMRTPETKNNFKDSKDSICCITSSNSTLMIGRESGIVMHFSLPHIQRINRYNVECLPRSLYLNCDSTKLAVVEANGVLTVWDLNSDQSDGKGISKLKIERKDCWNFVWSDDNPELFACMEKNRMYIFRKDKPEEPVASSAYLCNFSDLCITAVNLDSVMEEPEEYLLANPEDCVFMFETKSLRDTKDLISTTPMSEAYAFTEANPHPRLWRLLAEAALDELNFAVADKAFVHYKDYQGIQFVKRLKILASKEQQKAEVEAYFQRFAEAERLYLDMDKKDLAISLRMRLGDWFRVVQLVNAGAGNDEMVVKAWNNIGEYYMDRQKWNKAKRYFLKASNFEKVAECAYAVDDYDTLKKLLETIPDGTPWLKKLGVKFQSVGLCEEAVKAYMKMNDLQSGVECCVVLNQWNLAVKLTKEHKGRNIQGLLDKYATHLLEKKKHFEAIELYQKAGKFTESARLLAKLAKLTMNNKVNCLRAKKLYVLAALDVQKFKEKILSSKKITGKSVRESTQMALKSLMEADRKIGSDSQLENPWHGAMGLHLYLLAQRQLYTGHHSNAMHTALQLEKYEDVVDPKDIYSLIALAAYSNRFFGQCSRAFIRLESLETLTEDEKEKYKDLAISIFTKHEPKDPVTRDTKCPICGHACKPWETQCPHCNANIPTCTASGRPIFTQNYFTCKRCQFHIFEQLVRRFFNCPLCHANLQQSAKRHKDGR